MTLVLLEVILHEGGESGRAVLFIFLGQHARGPSARFVNMKKPAPADG